MVCWLDAETIFAVRFSLLRKRAGVSLQKIADDLGVTPQSLSLYEKGQRAININLLKAIAEYFKVSADYLIGIEKSTDFFELDGLIADINTTEIASHLNNMDEWTAKWRTAAEKALYKISEDCLK